jgi:predicted nucleotidyltransferase
VEPDQLSDVASRHGIRLIVQFGSTVTGRTHSHSDIDIGVLLEHMPPGFGALADLQTDLQRLFPGQELDLALINRADPLFLKQITGTCRLLFGAPRDLHALKMYAFKRYQDHRPYLAMERTYVAQAIRRLAG